MMTAARKAREQRTAKTSRASIRRRQVRRPGPRNSGFDFPPSFCPKPRASRLCSVHRRRVTRRPCRPAATCPPAGRARLGATMLTIAHNLRLLGILVNVGCGPLPCPTIHLAQMSFSGFSQWGGIRQQMN